MIWNNLHEEMNFLLQETVEWHRDAMEEDEIISWEEMKISQSGCYVETQFINQFILFICMGII